MKKTETYLKIAFVIVIASMVANMANATDIKRIMQEGQEYAVINCEASSLTYKLTKNGSEYARMMIPIKRNVGGFEFKELSSVMFFQPYVDQTKQWKTGTQVVIIAKPRLYQNRESFTVVAIQKPTQ